jgi:hypothetical protein
MVESIANYSGYGHGIEVAARFPTHTAKIENTFDSRNNSGEVFEQLTFPPAFVVIRSLGYAGTVGSIEQQLLWFRLSAGPSWS